MPWKDKTVKELRKEFCEAAKQSKNFSSLCREFEISRKTGYKWVGRYNENEELCDRSHIPNNIPHKTAPEIEDLILRVRDENPGWGAKTILKVLENLGYSDLPCQRTANNILQRNGCISEAESLKRKEFVRFQRDNCNSLWQMDFKGDFALGDGSRCFPLDCVDDHSRYCLMIDAKPNTMGVTQSVEMMFREYGMPKAILTDNGAQFAGFRGGYTKFERWLMDHDVLPIHGRIMHPQTQGKIERFHRTMKNELLKYNDFYDLSEAAQALSDWRKKYNEVRPHEALGMRCPADVYTPSTREYIEKVEPYDYSGYFRMIKVNSWGYLRFDDVKVYISETMAETRLEVRPMGDVFEVCYRNFKIAEIDAHSGKLLNRTIKRIL